MNGPPVLGLHIHLAHRRPRISAHRQGGKGGTDSQSNKQVRSLLPRGPPELRVCEQCSSFSGPAPRPRVFHMPKFTRVLQRVPIEARPEHSPCVCHKQQPLPRVHQPRNCVYSAIPPQRETPVRGLKSSHCPQGKLPSWKSRVPLFRFLTVPTVPLNNPTKCGVLTKL